MPTKKPHAAAKAAATKPATARKRTPPAQVATPDRTDVFISYSHPDKAWVEKLRSHLRPLERANVTVWVDTRLRAGDKWRAEIRKALAKTRVAILLISHHFLASDFIHDNELPPLLSAAASAGTIILPLLVSTSMFERTSLHEFQAVNPPEQPLDLLSEGQVNQVLAQVAQRVDDLFKRPATDRPQPLRPTSAARKAHSTPSVAAPAPVTGTKTPRRGTSKPDAKLAAKSATTKPVPAVRAQSALLVRQSGEWELLAVRHAVIGQELALTLTAATAEQTAFLTGLRRGPRELTSVSFNLQTYRCTLRELNAVIENGRESWHLTAALLEVGTRTELTYNGFTPEMQAQARAELLLLDSRSAEAGLARLLTSGSWLDEISASPLPALYQQLGSSAARFRQAAPLVVSWFLHFTGTVQHLLRLQLTLRGTRLSVDFEGRRDSPYRDAPVALRVQGTCQLDASAARPLLLGPVRGH